MAGRRGNFCNRRAKALRRKRNRRARATLAPNPIGPMAQRIPIQLHVANALQWLGTLYRNPADALKEHVSNAIDEHLKAKLDGTAHDRCEVAFTLDRHQVTIEYPYGMSRMELESALH